MKHLNIKDVDNFEIIEIEFIWIKTLNVSESKALKKEDKVTERWNYIMSWYTLCYENLCLYELYEEINKLHIIIHWKRRWIEGTP